MITLVGRCSRWRRLGQYVKGVLACDLPLDGGDAPARAFVRAGSAGDRADRAPALAAYGGRGRELTVGEFVAQAALRTARANVLPGLVTMQAALSVPARCFDASTSGVRIVAMSPGERCHDHA
jgi:hypothetical protein